MLLDLLTCVALLVSIVIPITLITYSCTQNLIRTSSEPKEPIPDSDDEKINTLQLGCDELISSSGLFQKQEQTAAQELLGKVINSDIIKDVISSGSQDPAELMQAAFAAFAGVISNSEMKHVKTTLRKKD